MEMKAENPVYLISDATAQPFLEAYFELAHLKQLYRQGWLRHGLPVERCESVAEHCFMVAVLSLWLGHKFPGLDSERVLRMALLHDIGEIYAGDIVPSDQVSKEQKFQLEKAAIEKVLQKLAGSAQYLELWQEFEQGTTPEARFVRQIDRLEMGLQARVYQAQGFEGMDEFVNSALEALEDPQLSEILREA